MTPYKSPIKGHYLVAGPGGILNVKGNKILVKKKKLFILCKTDTLVSKFQTAWFLLVVEKNQFGQALTHVRTSDLHSCSFCSMVHPYLYVASNDTFHEANKMI